MSKSIEPLKAQEIALKWQKLAERRHRHLLELQRSGRWKRYYSEDQFLAQLRGAERDIEDWAGLSGHPADFETVDEPSLKEAAE